MNRLKPYLTPVGVVTLIFCVVLVTNLLPVLRGGFGWVWMYDLPRFFWLIPCGLLLATYCVGTAHILRKAPRWLLLWGFIWSVLIPVALLTLQASPLYLLFSRTAVLGGYLRGATMTADLGQTLRDFPAFIAHFRAESVTTSGLALDPPGLLVVFRTVVSAFERVPLLADTFGALISPLQCQDPVIGLWTHADYAAAWAGMAMPLWAAFAIVPLRRLGRMIVGAEAANKAVALWPFIPGMALFVPRTNTVYPLLTLVMVLFLWIGITRKRLPMIATAGFILSAGTFMNLSLVPLGLLAGLFILGAAWQNKTPFTVCLIELAVFGAGVASVWVIYTALSGISPLSILQLGMSAHLTLDRPYLPWLFLHVWDLFMFIGLPVAMLALFGGWRAVRDQPSARLLLVTLALTTVLLDLSGTARGETGRVWLFFAPLWLLIAASVKWDFSRIAPVQALCLICMAAVLRVGFTALEQPAYPPTASNAMFAYDAVFVDGANRFSLIGLDTVATHDSITLSFYWRADTLIHGRYEFSLIGLRPDGTTLEHIDWTPEKRNYPPACWTPGRPFRDTVVIPTNGMAGNWTFSLQSWNSSTNTPTQVAGSDQVGIGPVAVP